MHILKYEEHFYRYCMIRKGKCLLWSTYNMWVQSLLCRNIPWVEFIVGELSQHLLTCTHTSAVACMLICMYRFCFKCYVSMILLRCSILWKWNLDWSLIFSLKIVYYLHRTNSFTYNILTKDLPFFHFYKKRCRLQNFIPFSSRQWTMCMQNT